MPGMNVTVALSDAELQAALRKIRSRTGGMRKWLGGILYRSAEGIMTEAKTLVPVQTGLLRSTGHVTLPYDDGGFVSVDLGFGGPAVRYAVVQHERLDYDHPGQGQAKYLEMPTLRWASTAAYVVGREVKLVLEEEVGRGSQ